MPFDYVRKLFGKRGGPAHDIDADVREGQNPLATIYNVGGRLKTTARQKQQAVVQARVCVGKILETLGSRILQTEESFEHGSREKLFVAFRKVSVAQYFAGKPEPVCLAPISEGEALLNQIVFILLLNLVLVTAPILSQLVLEFRG